MGKELELKYTLQRAEQIEEIAAHPLIRDRLTAPLREIRMDSVYFDTEGKTLSAAGISLRRRQENRDSVFTVKITRKKDGAFAERGEWQVFADTFPDALAQFTALDLPPEFFAAVADQAFVPIARTVFLRKTAPLSLGAELCLDAGHLGVLPFAEMELELTDGALPNLLAFGAQCAETFGLTPEPRSKLKRALQWQFQEKDDGKKHGF